MDGQHTKHKNDIVGIFQGDINRDGSRKETMFNMQNCLDAISIVKSRRPSYVTQAAFDQDLSIYEDAARCMGWIEHDERPEYPLPKG